MTYKYGIYQSTSSSCIFYKQDEDGNQSTFNIFVSPKNENKVKDVIAYIDNEQMKKENWLSGKNFDINELVEAFGGWAKDAPIIFELEAQKSMTHCLSSMIQEL
jgi:hypothetical protein